MAINCNSAGVPNVGLLFFNKHREVFMFSQVSMDFAIAGASSSVERSVCKYFQLCNQADFWAVANLFADQGQMVPPFEGSIVGRDAIRRYLRSEAHNLQLMPASGNCLVQSDGNSHVQVVGKVSTLLFRVNVRWSFLITPQGEILQLAIELLASLQELAQLQQMV